MKSLKIRFIILLLTITTTTISQNSIGVFGGINATGITYDFFGTASFQESFGFHIGGSYKYKLDEKIFIRPSVVLSQQGDRQDDFDDNLWCGTIDYKLTYLNIPIDIGYQLKNINFFIGPKVGFLLKQDIMSEYLGKANSLDFGVNIGFGLKSIENDLFVNFKLFQGIATVLKVEYYNPGGVYKHNMTNQVVQMSIGYYIK